MAGTSLQGSTGAVSGQDRDHARGEAAPLGRLRERHDHESAVLGHPIEVREHLDLIVVGAENVRLHRIVVLGGVETAIGVGGLVARGRDVDRKSTRLNSSHLGISYAVFCLKKKKKKSLIVQA